MAAFKALGMEEVCTAFSQALAHFPNGRPFNDSDERIRIYNAVPKDERDRLDKVVWRSDEIHRTQLANYIRSNKTQIEEILSDYAVRKRTLEQEDLAVDSSWDMGDKPVKDVMADVLLRLYSMPPGAVLALVANHPGEGLPGVDDGLSWSAPKTSFGNFVEGRVTFSSVRSLRATGFGAVEKALGDRATRVGRVCGGVARRS